MKILIIAKTFPPQKIGGAEVYVQNIASTLSEKKHAVIVITQEPYHGFSSLFPRLNIKNGIKFYRFYPLNIFSLYNAKNKPLFLKGIWRIIDLLNPFPAIFIYRIIRKEKPDIIHFNMLLGFSQFFLIRLIKLTKIPAITTLLSYELFCLRCDLLRNSERLCQKMPFHCFLFTHIAKIIIDSIPKVVISPSKFCIEIYEKHGFFKKSKKIILPFGIKSYNSNPHLSSPLAKEDFVILYTGRLVKLKGIHVLISAFRKLPHKNIKLLLVGSGNYEKTLKELSASDNRIFFTGPLSYRETLAIYQKADVTVVPSIGFEILSLSAIESLTAGTPVIASRIGGMQELIKDDYNGYLFQPNDVEELKSSLEFLINNPAKLKGLRTNAFNSSKSFSLEKYTLDLEKIYTQSINDNS